MRKDNGGPDFPLIHDPSPHDSGMTMRDWFAGKALAALIGHPDKDYPNRGGKAVPRLAEWAYEYADAMLKERAKASQAEP